MRWSKLFTPTLRDAPNDAVAPSHRLLIRGGFMRQLHAGHYSMLPLGWKVHQKVANIVREEIERIGGQEFLLPTMHPAEIWQKSGRWDTMGEIMFRLEDRRGAAHALGITHEEIFATVASELSSYKQLPQIWYHIQTKFRDEARPKSGLLRVREFHMKDSYSFDLDQAGLDASFDLHDVAYRRIFSRIGIPAFGVQASSGAMGGNDSVEFMTPSDAGEDDVIRCPRCDYSANIEKGTSALPPAHDEPGPDAPERFDTPGVRTIKALEDFDGGAPADRQLKTLVMVLDGVITLVVVRGDHQLNTQKLADATGAIDIRPAEVNETAAALGARPGSLGAVGVTDHPVIMDEALRGRTSMTTGANTDDVHLRGVSVERDVEISQWADLREVQGGEPCPNCGAPLSIVRCIEIGHIFKLGTHYAEVFGAKVSTPEGGETPIVMGSYGIGIGRNMAASAEANHDDKGLVWPVSIAPFEAVITLMRLDDESMAVGERLYNDLRAAGVDVLLDDRDARAGVKFADAELIGIPFRITVGPRGIKEGKAEVNERASGQTVDVDLDSAAARVWEAVTAAKA
jgi:prolyl-tRNA synthetase